MSTYYKTIARQQFQFYKVKSGWRAKVKFLNMWSSVRYQNKTIVEMRTLKEMIAYVKYAWGGK